MATLRAELSVASTELERGDRPPLVAYQVLAPNGRVLEMGVYDPMAEEQMEVRGGGR